MQPGGYLGLESDGPNASSTTLDPDGVAGSSGGERTIVERGISLRVQEPGDIPALVLTGSSISCFLKEPTQYYHGFLRDRCFGLFAIVTTSSGHEAPAQSPSEKRHERPNPVGCRHLNGSDRQISSSEP